MAAWREVSTLPYSFYQGSAVVLDGEIHILGSNIGGSYTKHYKYSNGEWIPVSTLPYNFYAGSAVVLDGDIHILGSNSSGSGNRVKHYKYSNGSWTEVSTLPYDFYYGSAVVLDGDIHILGGISNYNYTKHYVYFNGRWMNVSTLPYSFYEGSAVVLDGEIHILGTNSIGNYTKHYKSIGTWTEVSTLPYNFYDGFAVVLDGDIHILGSNSSGYSSSNRTKHYKYHIPINKVIYGNKTLIDLTSDTIASDKMETGITAHSSSGDPITGTGGKLINSMATNCKFIRNLLIVGGSQTPVDVLLLGTDQRIGMYASGGDIKLINRTSSSEITIASPGASYVSTFKLLSVNYLNRTQALIRYRYETNASGLKSRIFLRLITLKNDGTLAQSSAINTTDAPSATVDTDGCLIPMYNDYAASFLLVQWKTTISTGAVAIYASRVYVTYTTGALALPSSSAWVTLSASNVNSGIPDYFNDNTTEYGGLLLYDGGNSKNEVLIWAGYSGGYKDVYTSAAGDIDNIGVQNHIIGKSVDGYLVVFQPSSGKFHLYEYDPITCYFSLCVIHINSLLSNHNIYMLSNGLILDKTSATIYSINKSGLQEIGKTNIVYPSSGTAPEITDFGPLSDPFQGIFIY